MKAPSHSKNALRGSPRSACHDRCEVDGAPEFQTNQMGYPVVETGVPIPRLKPTGNSDKVRLGYLSHHRKWQDVDDMGGVVMPLDDALDFIANESNF